MIELYSKSYSKLIGRAKNYSKDDEGEEEEPPEKTAPPERQVINLAQEAPPANSAEWSKYFETTGNDEEPKKKIKNEANSVAPNMMDARTISFKDSYTKIKNDEAKLGGMDQSGSVINIPGINNSLLLNLLQNKAQETLANQTFQTLNGFPRMQGAPNPLLNTLAQATGNRLPNPTQRPGGPPGVENLLMMMYQNQLNARMPNATGAPGSLIGPQGNQFNQAMIPNPSTNPILTMANNPGLLLGLGAIPQGQQTDPNVKYEEENKNNGPK